LRVGERVPVQSADDDERDHEQQQFPVQYLVQTTPPQEQQFGESRAARRRHLGLVADGHRGRLGDLGGDLGPALQLMIDDVSGRIRSLWGMSARGMIGADDKRRLVTGYW